MNATTGTESDNVEFLRPRAASQRFGVSLRMLHYWMSKNAIESHLVKTPGRQKAGARLINVASLRAFITGRKEEQ